MPIIIDSDIETPDPDPTPTPPTSEGAGPVTVDHGHAVWPQTSHTPPPLSIGSGEVGLFAEFSEGVTGVAPNKYDPPQPTWYSGVQIGGTGVGQFVYANDILLSPLPGAVKFSADLGASFAGYFTWGADAVGELTDHYGSMYVYMDTGPSTSFPVRILRCNSPDGGICCYFLLETSGKISVYSGPGVLKGQTTAVLAAATWYRVEWHIVHTSDATGTVEVRLFEEHNSIPLDSFTTPAFDNKVACNGFWAGAANGTSTGGKVIRFAAVAAACTDWVGPYNGPYGRNIEATADDYTPYEQRADGSLIVRSSGVALHDPGGTPHDMIQRGDQVFRVDPHGNVIIGRNLDLQNPMEGDADPPYDIFLSSRSGRGHFTSLNLGIVDDPADISMGRVVPFQRTGTGASTTNGSNVVSFSDLQLSLHDRGKTLLVDGDGYNILELLGPTSCTVDPVPAADGTGLAWQLVAYPYPGKWTIGAGNGTVTGQIRSAPSFFHYVRSNPTADPADLISTTSGSGTFIQGANNQVTTADIGRHLLLNSDRSFGEFLISGVSGANITVTPVAPYTMAGCTWDLSSGNTLADVTAYGPATYDFEPFTLGWRMDGDASSWGSNRVSAPTAMVCTIATTDLDNNSVGRGLYIPSQAGTYEVLRLRSDRYMLFRGGIKVGGGTVGTHATTATGVNALNSAALNCGSTFGMLPTGTAKLGGVDFSYTGLTATSFTGCGNHAATTGGEAITQAINITKGLGYNPLTVNTVTQGTSKSTAVNINNFSGKIVTNNANLVAGTTVVFTVYNGNVTVDDIPHVALRSGQATPGTYMVAVDRVAAGAFDVAVTNITAGDLNEALTINFYIFKNWVS